MPRYCAVKLCRNRAGAASVQDSKRISFYPFPLHDKSRLQKWVGNIKREGWTPSRHQYVCSEHFTEECFDIRWGIRYLRNTAVPTIFPSAEDDEDKKVTVTKRSVKAKPRTLDVTGEREGFDSSLSKRPVISGVTCDKSHTTHTVAERTEMTVESPEVSDTGVSCHSDNSGKQTVAYELTGEMTAASCLAVSPHVEPHAKEQTDLLVTTLRCDKLDPTSGGEANAAALRAALCQAFSSVPTEMVRCEQTCCFSEETESNADGQVTIYEHSYCRPDTDKEKLWSKISSLHAKILELDRREEKTVAKIRSLEAEITSLKRDGAVFKKKQEALEDFISSRVL